MGNCESYQETASFRKIEDSPIEQPIEEEQNKLKFLFLGASEAGKTTIFQQLRIMHGPPRNEWEDLFYGVLVRSNIKTAIKRLCQHLRDLGLEEDLEAESAANKGIDESKMTVRQAYDEIIAHFVDRTEPLIPEDYEEDWEWISPRAGPARNLKAQAFLAHAEAIQTLWESQTMKIVWPKRNEVNVIDIHKDFLNDIPRIASDYYFPTTRDVLKSRSRSHTEVTVDKYDIKGLAVEVYDVCGQKSSRSKWAHYFDDVDAVIFVAALSEYDQNLNKSDKANRLEEAIESFRTVCNHPAFARVKKMLFLNKKDVFAEKIMYSDIAAQPPFADYDGPPQDYKQGVEYFIQKFKDCYSDDTFKDSFIHITNAIDTDNMERVLQATRDAVINDTGTETKGKIKGIDTGVVPARQNVLQVYESHTLNETGVPPSA